MAKKGFTIKAPTQLEVIKHTRSPFANFQYGGYGAHRSKKDYNRQSFKKEARRAFLEN